MASYTSPSNAPVVEAAFRIAERIHCDERRKGLRVGTTEHEPYIVHLLKTYEILEKAFADGRPPHGQITRAAALLHDVMENDKTGTLKTEAQLSAALVNEGVDAELATKITHVVEEVTDREDPRKKGRPQPRQQARTERLLERRHQQARKIAPASPEAKIIKITDQIAGMIDTVEFLAPRYLALNTSENCAISLVQPVG